MSLHFEVHRSPGASRLDAWRAEVSSMRTAGWPCQRIADWLAEKHDLRLSGEAIRQYCVRRKIPKHQDSGACDLSCSKDALPEKPVRTPGIRKSARAKIFQYDGGQPIELRDS